MPTAYRIATWNLERPRGNTGVVTRRQLAKINEIDADLWILTETHESIAIPGFNSKRTEPIPDYHCAGESCAAIHSRWPILETISTCNDRFAVCARVCAPWGLITVYASIITYFGDRRADGSGKNWELHREQIVEQGNDWAKLCRQYPRDLLCVAGDFNQSLDRSTRSTEARSDQLLRAALHEGALTCLTSRDFSASGELETRHSVDHICFSEKHGDFVTVTGVGAWEGRAPTGPMSDHNGVYVTFDAETAGLTRRAQSQGIQGT